MSPEEVLELDSDDRKTQKVSAEHFRSMRRAVAVRDAVGTIKKPEPSDTVSPPLEHEELASSNLIAEALAQLRAGARLETNSDRERVDTDEAPPVRADEVAIAKIDPISIPIGVAKVSPKAVAAAAVTDAIAKERSAPSTIPMTTKELTELGALKPRHAIKMAPLTKPPDLERVPAATRTDEKVIDASESFAEPPRSDVGLLIVAGVLVLGVIATIALILASG